MPWCVVHPGSAGLVRDLAESVERIQDVLDLGFNES